MEKRLTLLLACLFLSIGMAIAQTKVTGTVVNAEDGQPIVGASVKVAGAKLGTITDTDGKFSITAPKSATHLNVSYIGCVPQSVAIRSTVRVVLKSNSEELGEVVVTAYGTTKKTSFAGSAAEMKGTKLQEMQTSNIAKSLEGAVAGVQIAQSSGQPGAGGSILVRGIGSISASQNPLIVVDGIPYEGSLNSISTQDIESLTVLKDAAANSMYGARGANGVIMITTKKGKSGKPKVTFDARLGVNSREVPMYNVMKNPGQYYTTYWKGLKNYIAENFGVSDADAASYASANLIDDPDQVGSNLGYNIYSGVSNAEVVGTDGTLNPNATTEKWSDRWTKEPFKNQARQDYNFNVSGANNGTSYYVSLEYLKDKGYIKSSDFERISTRAKVEQEVTDWFKVGANLTYAHTKQNAPNTTADVYTNLFMFSQMIAPIYPVYLHNMSTGDLVYDRNGNQMYDFGDTYKRPYASSENPMATNMMDVREYIIDNFSARGFAEFKFLKDFKFTANASYDVFANWSTEMQTPIGGDAQAVNGRSYKDFGRYGAFNINELLNYTHQFGKHNLSLLLGHENKFDTNRDMYGQMTNIFDSADPEFSNAATFEDLQSSRNEYSIEGYFARAEYNYNETYYATASIRRDGSSVFDPSVRWGTFWAVGGAWRITKEDFMKDLYWVNEFKLKASYGTQGNDNIGVSKAYLNHYTVSRVNQQPALVLSFRGNKDLTWEKSRNFNVGFESKFLNRINVDFEFFIKETRDMLYQSPLALSQGTPSFIWRNEMNMKNTGIDFDINADVIKTNDITLNLGFNGLTYKNELTKLPADKDPNGYQAGSYWRMKGGSLYRWYLPEYAGVDQTTGKALYNVYSQGVLQTTTDANGNVVPQTTTSTSEAGYCDTGKNAIPGFIGGFSASLKAYGFDFSLQTAFQLGGWTLDSSYETLMGCTNGQNFHKDMLNAWTKAGDVTDVPRICLDDQDMNGLSTRWLTRSSYFNLRNLTIGYTFPKKIAQALLMESLRVYGTADNLFFISARKGLDPRQSYNGTISENYSAMRTVSLGVTLNF